MTLSLKEQQEVRDGNLATERPSMRRRINLQCKACLYDDKALGLGTWRQQVEACDDVQCPLWALRPKADLRDRAAESTGFSTAGAS